MIRAHPTQLAATGTRRPWPGRSWDSWQGQSDGWAGGSGCDRARVSCVGSETGLL